MEKGIMKKTLGTARALLVVLPLGFSMSALASGTLSVTESADVTASPNKVWKVIGDFAGLPRWHPVVATTDIVKGRDNRKGAFRSITTKDGAKIVEELLAYNKGEHRMTYRIKASPLPVTDYVSTLSVMSVDGGARITWQSSFNRDVNVKGVDDDKVKNIISGIYKTGFEGLRVALDEDVKNVQ